MNRPKRPQKAEASRDPVATRVRATLMLVICMIIGIPFLFTISGGRYLLMPGPLSSGHSAIKQCQTCHTAAGNTQFSWLDAILTRDPHSDTLACLGCHTIQKQIAFYPHTATPLMLNSNLEHLRAVAAQTPRPIVANLRDIAFPMDGLMNSEINCATCHEDHRGANFDITTISDARCQSCHAVQFDDFDGNHPDFSNYPFKRRQRIKFDHVSHFTKHYPEVASKNEPGRRTPDTCAACHTSGDDRRHMNLVQFDQICSSCHIDQITGVERAIGPKGLAFLTLPGLDLQTLSEKGAAIGEWPEFSEAELSPFMALIIGQKPEGQAILNKVRNLDLLDLTAATDDEINAVAQLVWTIKGLFYTFLSGKASDVLADLNTSRGTQVNPLLISDLSANLPRDVLINAQIEWLPNLATEMLQRRASLDQQGSGWASAINEQKLSARVALDAAETGFGAPANPPELSDEALIRLAQAVGGENENWTIDVYGRLVKGPPGAANVSSPVPGAAGNNLNVAQAPANDGQQVVAQYTPAAGPAPSFAPIESSVDTESWAEYGGWYRRDFAIYYRPVGHKDKFIYTWLNLTGPYASANNSSPASNIFQRLTSKDAQGQCVKCHSVDIRNGGGLTVNWGPSSFAKDKSMRFTKFVHEPHFAVMENDSCLSCHQLNPQADFEKTYEQNDPTQLSSNFSKVKKGLCLDCHGAGNARQDCLLCHQYHVQDVITPILRTQLPRQ